MSAVLYGVFFASGVAALIFETLWFHQAGLAFGNSVWASSLVLSGFMAGTALGNALAGRVAGRVGNVVRAYAVAEAAIAVAGVALVFVLPGLGQWLGPWLRPLEATPWLLNVTRLVVGFVVLLVPSTAMGTTLPLLTSALAARDRRYGVVLGRLYGWNTVGAVVGVLACEQLLLARLGVRGTAVAAGALSLLAAGVATALSARLSRAADSTATAATIGSTGGARHNARVDHEAPDRPLTVHGAEVASVLDRHTVSPVVWLAAVSASGFCLLALEVVWFRMLLLVVLGESGAFAVMLAVVLAGVAAGGLLASRWLRVARHPGGLVAPAAFAAAVLTVGGYAIFPWTIRPFETRQVTAALDILRVGVPLMFPVSLVSGVFFTVVGAAFRHTQRSDARATGALTLANTAGAAVGSLAGGFVLLPLLGMERSVFGIAVLYAVTGAWVLLRTSGPVRWAAWIPAAVGVLVLGLFPFGTMQQRLLQLPVTRYAALRGGTVATVEAVREGLSETTVYLQVPTPVGPMFHTMYTNSVAMADTEYVSRRYMKLYVYWPTAVHANLKHALLIAYGVGNSAKAMTDSPNLETIDVVDISRDVLDLNRVVYPHEADSPLHDPRVRVHIEDGRYFLQATDQRFDLITSEPPPPRSAGVVNLYTREYFQLMRDRLAEGGMVAYWLPIHALSDVSTKAVLRAFCDVFDDCSLWNGIGSQLMMVGTRGATGPVSAEHFARQWRQPVVAAEMARLGFERPEQLGALFIGDAPYLRALTKDVGPLVDDRPKAIEVAVSSQGDAQRLGTDFLDTDAARERFRASPLIGRLWPPSMIDASLPYFDIQKIVNAHGYALAIPMAEIHRVITGTALKTLPLWLLGSNADFQRVVAAAESRDLAAPPLQFHLGVRLLAERQFTTAVGPLSRAESLPGARDRIFGLRLYALCMAGRTREAQELADERPGDRPRYWSWLKDTFGLTDARPSS